MRGGAKHIKHPEDLNFYHNYNGDKCNYGCFFDRIHQQGLPYEEAIKPETLKGKHLIKTKIDENGRVCTKCLKYKTRDKFSKTKGTLTRRTPDCLDCRRKLKKEYRKKTNYKKDREYKKKRRTLNIGDIIIMEKERYIDGYPREDKYEVIEYKFKQGYLIKSLIDGLYKRIDLNDNGKRPKFYLFNKI